MKLFLTEGRVSTKSRNMDLYSGRIWFVHRSTTLHSAYLERSNSGELPECLRTNHGIPRLQYNQKMIGLSWECVL